MHAAALTENSVARIERSWPSTWRLSARLKNRFNELKLTPQPTKIRRSSDPMGNLRTEESTFGLMTDLIAIAFQQDLTRVATLVIDPERWDTPRMYHGVFDSPQNHHVLTHTKGDEAKETLKKIDRFHVDQFAYLIRRLSEIPEADGSLLDNCLLSYGSGMGNGTVHDYNDLPIVTAGGLGKAIRTGQHFRFENKVPGRESVANGR